MNIIKNRKFWLIFAAVMVVLSVIILFFFRPKLGIDFTGGSLVEVKLSNSVDVEGLRKTVGEITGNNVAIQESGSNQFIIRTPQLEGDTYQKFQSNITTKYPNIIILRHQSIGAIVGRDVTNKAIEAFLLASVLIILYLAYSFRNIPKSLSSWVFGSVAIITLVHDLATSTAVFSIIARIAGYEFDSMFVVAVLTILGFSVHDTIVVFDRIRENTIKNPQMSLAENAEVSINQTIARSLNTSLTAILVLVAMLILGGATIKPFVWMLTIGITIGTYSSIFVASPLLVTWFEARDKRTKRTQNVSPRLKP